MAEIQQSTNAADITQRFIELVMMNAQQAALCLGQMVHPSSGKAEVNLDAAKMFIDHLEIIKEKTRGNLTKDEEKILTSVLTELQMAFVQVASGCAGETGGHEHDENCDHGDHGHDAPSSPPSMPDESSIVRASDSSNSSGEEDGKKRFTKSYGS